MVRMDDHDLISQTLAGLEASFEALLVRYRPLVWGIAWRIALNEEDALDICQEVMIRAWRNLGRLPREGNVAAWLRTIAVRESLRWVGRNGHTPARQSIDLPGLSETFRELQTPPVAPESLAAEEQRRRILNALAGLSPRQRTAITLRHFNDLSLKEIAAAMGCAQGSVKRHLFRALEHLRQTLDAKEQNHE